MHAVAHRIRRSFRREAQVEAHLPGDLAGDLAHVDGTISRRYAERRAAGDFVLMLAVFRQKHFRLDTAGAQGAEQPAAELGTLALGFEGESQMLGKTGVQVEFMFERGVDLQAQFIAITFDFITQQRARAGAPRAAIGFANIAVDKIQRRRVSVRAVANGDAAAQIGNQPQIAIGAPRIGRSNDVLRRQCAVGRHPLQPAA